jgi:hypothetical protein
MAEFIGLQMLVTLQGDPPTSLKGTVSAVEAGSGLTLSNGEFHPSTLKHTAHYNTTHMLTSVNDQFGY